MAKTKRKGLSKRHRFAVFNRDEFTCQYCGRHPPEVKLEADHIEPLALGGEDHERNMITACRDCNRGKSDIPLSRVSPSIDEQMRDRQERAEQVEAYSNFLMGLRQREGKVVDQVSTYWCNRLYPDEQDQWRMSDDRETSIRMFLKRLPASEIYEAIDLAFSRIRPTKRNDAKAFKYFCGICWKKIKTDIFF
jgi:hypothetical protein